ncbi:MAG: hypothetical protein CM15mP102_20090 [Flavobacteriales bacterium]|nr:MAG: hypothetical protein CM15mP102_20090 [Flavobacteriales bacterium]
MVYGNLIFEAINNIPFFIGIIAFVILYQGNYKIIERPLIFLVLLMGSLFFFYCNNYKNLLKVLFLLGYLHLRLMKKYINCPWIDRDNCSSLNIFYTHHFKFKNGGSQKKA